MNIQRGFSTVAATRLITLVIAMAMVLLVFFSSCTTVASGHVGVPQVFGRVQEKTLEPGIHLINPFASVTHLDTRTQTYTMSHVSSEGQKGGDDSVDVISSDGLKVNMDISVIYNLQPDKAIFVVKTIGGDISENIVRPQIRAAIRDNAAAHTAVELYSSKKDIFVANVQKQLQAATTKYGIETQQVLLRSIQLPPEVMKAITDKMQAQQASQAMQYKLEQTKQEADRQRAEAQGEADANRIRTQQLTPEILEARRIDAFKELAKSGNMVIVPAGNQMLLNLPAKK